MSHKRYFTPGPSQLFYTFEQHFKQALIEDIPSISHRSKAFIKVVEETTESLRELLQLPDDYYVFYLNSANEAWDRIIQNLVVHSSHHFANGSFSQKFYDFSIEHGMASSLTSSGDGQKFTSLEIPEEAELIGIAKNETSVGFSFKEEEIKEIRSANPDKIIALDVVSAVPSLIIDFAQVDTAYFSVQKAFGLPAGLGVWIANERCIERSVKKSERQSVGSYRTLPNLKKFGTKHQTPETPNMLFIYLLGKIAQDMLDVGITKLRNDTIYKATILNQMIIDHPAMEHFVDSSEHRSKSTIVAKTAIADKLIEATSKKGLIIGSGYGVHKGDHIRIANFPSHSKESVEMLCDLLAEIE